MIEGTRKSIYLLSLQILSFVLLLLFSFEMDYTRISAVILLVIEIALLVKIKKGLGSFILLWQAQLFSVAFVGIAFFPSFFLNLNPITTSVQIAIAGVILFIESVVLVLYYFNEKGVVWILKGSTVSLIAVVLLVLIIIGSEGIPGFVENDPIKMLTTSGFAPYAQPTSESTLNLTVQVNPYDFTLSPSSSTFYLAPFSNSSFNLTISNTGALDDSYLVSYGRDPFLDVNVSSPDLQIRSGESANMEVFIKSTDQGQYILNFMVSDRLNITRGSKVQVIVSTSGLDFVIARNVITIANHGSSDAVVPLGILNAGTSNNTYVLRVSAPSGFYPSFAIPEWSYVNNSATITLEAGELRNIPLIPRQLTSIDGTYPFKLIASSVSGNQTIAALNITLILSNNKIISAARPGPIPLSPGNTTTWNISVYSSGSQRMQFDIPDVPKGLSIEAFTNGTSEIPNNNGWIFLDQNLTSDQVQLKVTLINSTLLDNSSFLIVLTTPGSPFEFGLLGFIAGSFITTIMALIIAVPLAIACAIFLSEYCTKRIQQVIKPIMEILAGIPSVIFGLWGALTFGPLLATTIYPFIDKTLGSVIPFFHGGGDLSGRSLMTASVVLGIMIFPIIMSLSYEAITAVPSDLKEGSESLGATKWQTVRRIILRKAKPGIMGSIILGTGRALGETMAVLMILGFTSAVPSSIFDTSGTMTSAIATTLTGVFSTTQAREGIFAIALLLFIIVLILNAILIMVTKEGFWNGKRIEKLRIRTTASLKKWFNSLWRSRIKNDKKRPQEANQFLPSKVLERKNRIATICLYLAAAIMLVVVGYIIGDIIFRGGLAFKSEYLTETQLNGGFLNAITGSLMLVGVALAVAVPLTVLAAIHVHEYSSPDSILSRGTYISVSTLSSTPSIVFGAFGFLLFILYLNFGFSLLSAGLTLACMILPILYISNMGALRDVPNSHREASYALGVSKWKTITGIVLPASFPAISSGVFISIGRAIGETAAVLLTAGFLVDNTTSLVQPVASMPVLIYNMFDSSAGNPIAMQKLYAAAFLLIVIVIALNMIGKMLSHFYQEKYYGSK